MDAGLVIYGALALGSAVSAAAGRPWTILLSRRTVAPERRTHPLFRETNTVMTLVWAALFGAAAALSPHGGWLGHLVVGAALTGLGAASPAIAARYVAWRIGRR